MDNQISPARQVAALFAAAVMLTGCAASPSASPTPVPKDAPSPVATSTPPSTTPTPASTAASTATPSATPSTAATTTPGATATPAGTAVATALDGAYVTTFTKDDLQNSPLLIDQGEVNDGNWGSWTLTFDQGIVAYAQTNDVKLTESSGTFAVDGDALTMAFDRGENVGEEFAFRWQLHGTNLTFQRDATLGTGPTPFLVQPWTLTGTATPIPLPGGGATLFPSTYKTAIQPGLTLTVGHEVDLDCANGYICRGDVDANFPFWLDLEFGNAQGSELMVLSFDMVLDPAAPGQLIELPADFAAWIADQPQFTIAEAPHAVVIGGVEGQEFDIKQVGDDGLALYPTGFEELPSVGIGSGRGEMARIDLLRTGGRQIVIERMLGPENSVHDFGAAVDGLQPVLDSITWR